MARRGYPSWFEKLFGFPEALERDERGAFAKVQASFDHDFARGTLRSRVSGSLFVCGVFSTPTLGQLRAEAREALRSGGSAPGGVSGVSVTHFATYDILEEHARHPGAVFQAASQLNCLEMPSRGVTPEAGITGYEHDFTQGPACSIACAAGTVVRNYLVDVAALSSPHRRIPAGGPLGQRADRQINTLDEVEAAVGNAERCLWTVRNGYFCASKDRLRELGEELGGAKREALLALLKVGVQAGVGVTFARGASVYEPPAAPVAVTQVYCSAVPVDYDCVEGLRPAACFLLDGLYEATLWAAVLNAARTGCPDVFLTFVGGGVWGNELEWIAAAIGRAVARVSAAGAALRVHLCHFRAVDARWALEVDRAVARARGGAGGDAWPAAAVAVGSESESLPGAGSV